MILFLMLAAVLVIYSRSIRGEFLFDDHAISDMDFSRWELGYQGKDTPDDSPSFIKACSYTFMESRSLTHLGYLWTWQLFGFRPLAWHAVNIGLHLANTLLVYLLSMLIRPDVAGPAAFLFAVHPHQVAAVSYISGRASLQMIFFALAATYSATLPVSLGFVSYVLSFIFAKRSKEDGYLWTIALSLGFAALHVFFHSI